MNEKVINALECFAIDKYFDCSQCVGCAFETKDVCDQNMIDEIAKLSLELINQQKAQIEILKDLINGEWVDCDKVQEALSIDFSTGLKMFDFGRTAEWNPSPFNGQKITTQFRLKTPKNARWKGAGMGDYYCSLCQGIVSGNHYSYCPHCGAKMDKGELHG